MIINNKVKNCLAKIKIAQLIKKKKIKLKVFLTEIPLLDILWQKGFILGYSMFGNKNCYIFLKYNLMGFGLLESLNLINYKLNTKNLAKLLQLDYYSGYFIVSTKKKIQYYSGKRFLNLNQHIVYGELVAKL